MVQLEKLGMQAGWTYEAIVSTFADGVPHAAPIGVRSHSPNEIHMDIYEGSQTLENIVATGYFVVNFPTDVDAFFAALFAPHTLTYTDAREARAPILSGCSAAVELALGQAIDGPHAIQVVGVVLRSHISQDLRLINRAEGLLLESLILATRLDRLGKAVLGSSLVENYRVIRKVAPGSPLEATMAQLLRNVGLPS